jgi:hypothetical protein
MSDPFDPVDDWLGTDVELLPPPSGAFDRVHRRARRRKAVVAMGTAAGVAVAIAAAATLPQLASILGPGHGGGSAKIPVASSSQSPRPSHSPSNTSKPHRSSSAPQTTQTNLAITDSSQPPTPDIAPSSVTFVTGTIGAVIGETTSGCPTGCEAVAGTSNYGQTWTKADPPPAGPPNGNSGVSQIRFLEQNNGWAYGPGLYVTHNGGATWVKATGVYGRVIDLATVNGSAYAVVGSCTGTGADYASDCSSFALYTSAYTSDSFQLVPGASGNGPEAPGGLQLTNDNGYLLAGHVLFTGSPDGGPWQAITISSGTVPACLTAKGHSVAPGESGLLAPSAASDIYLLCQPAGGGGSLYISTDSGATWQLAGKVKTQGVGTSLAIAPTSGTLVLATSAGIYYSPDARHWRRASLSNQAQAGGFGFSFIGMTTQMNGVAVPAGPGSTVIYVTHNGGLTWRPKHIS